MLGTFRRLHDDRSGVTAIEYAVILSLIALAIIISIDGVGTNLAQTFAAVDGALPQGHGGGGGGGGGHDGDGGHGDHDGH